MRQLELTFTGSFGGQLKRLYDALCSGEKITCQDAERLGIAGTALPRRVKDLTDKYDIPVNKEKIDYVRSFDNKTVQISQYTL